MPATAWTVQKSNLGNGLLPTNQAIDSVNGNKFKNNGKTRVRFKGAAAATGTVTIDSAKACSQGFDHNPVSLANALDTAAEELEFGPFPQERFNDSNGEVTVTYTGTVTGITANVIEDV